MEITPHNYEAYFLDWIEGRLSKKLLLELEEFLKQNPKLKEELDAFQDVKLEPAVITFENKNQLYRHEFDKTEINENNFSDFCIAHYENILSENKRNELLKFASKSDTLKTELIYFRKVYLAADDKTEYPFKEMLYKTRQVKIPSNRKFIPIWGSIAAGIAILATLYVTLPNKKDNVENQITKISKTIVKEPKVNNSEKVIALVDANKIVPVIKSILSTKSINQSVKVENRVPGEIELKPLAISKLNVSIKNPEQPIEEHNFDKRENTFSVEENADESAFSKNSLLALAETGINKFGKITGSNIELTHVADQNGKISYFNFKAGFFQFSRRLNR